jgi:hypothetical protein
MAFDESKHPRDGNGKFTDGNSVVDKLRAKNPDRYKPEPRLTPEQKIASVKINPNGNTILPELNDGDWQKIGSAKNKQVLVKESVFGRQEDRHPDAIATASKLVAEALYTPSEIFSANDDPNKNYFEFAKLIRVSPGKYATVILDVNDNGEHFEVVHWHYRNEKAMERMINKNNPQK